MESAHHGTTILVRISIISLNIAWILEVWIIPGNVAITSSEQWIIYTHQNCNFFVPVV